MPGSISTFTGPTTADKNITRQNIAAVSTLDELITITPRAFGPEFGYLYRELNDLAIKLCHVKTSLQNLNDHQSKGSYPPQILGALKPPQIQVTKEFQSHSVKAEYDSTALVTIKTARDSWLQDAITLKESERDYLAGLLSTDTIQTRAKELHMKVNNALCSAFATGKDEKGATVYSDVWIQETNFMASSRNALCMKAVAIGLTKHQKELVTKMAKMKIKKDTEVEMRDMTTNDVSKQIEMAVKTALKKAFDKKTSPQRSESTRELFEARLTPLRSKQTEEASQTRSKWQQTKTNGEFQEKGEQIQGTRKRKRENEEEGQKKLMRIMAQTSDRFNPRDVFTYPEEFFHSDPYTRRRFMLLHSSLDFVNSIPSYQADIFLGKGVHLDLSSRQSLNLNGKFVLHCQKNPSLLPQAISQLRRTIRIRWFFRHKSLNTDRSFHVKSDWEPPKATARIERAIEQTEAALLSQDTALPSRSYMLNPEVKTLCQYLREKQYLVKITDKNLGLAVVTRQWYMEQCLKHLSQQNAYEESEPSLEDLACQLKDLVHSFQWNKETRKYLQTTTADLPRFHVIPKVHKTPWASRPIIPSHSWVTSRASEVIDKYLQKFVRRIPYVLDSSKTFVNKIRQIHLEGQCTLVTGDVKAMYTNIPLEGAKYLASEALKKVDTENNPVEGLWGLLFFVLENNYFEFDQKTYKQLNGIAMGTSCAPCVANIYAAYYERKFVEEWSEKGLLFYARYIDDIFLVFQGNNLDECLAEHHIPGLEIGWERSPKKMSFLDVLVSIEDGKIETDIFRKELNRYLYIPFSSGHPISVKKALVKAELTRMKLLCSSQEKFKECTKIFRANLYRRGYPGALLDQWFSLELKPPEEKKAFLLLPSEYNPIWEYTVMSKLEKAWTRETADIWKELPDDLRDPRFIKCLKRGKNMYDWYNRENLTILNQEATFGHA